MNSFIRLAEGGLFLKSGPHLSCQGAFARQFAPLALEAESLYAWRFLTICMYYNENNIF